MTINKIIYRLPTGVNTGQLGVVSRSPKWLTLLDLLPPPSPCGVVGGLPLLPSPSSLFHCGHPSSFSFLLYFSQDPAAHAVTGMVLCRGHVSSPPTLCVPLGHTHQLALVGYSRHVDCGQWGHSLHWPSDRPCLPVGTPLWGFPSTSHHPGHVHGRDVGVATPQKPP